MRAGSALAAAGMLVLAACTPQGAPEQAADNEAAAEAEPETVDVPQDVAELAPGTTPMAERVAVLGILNKRNGISRDIEMRPGQATRLGDLIVRLRACETSAPWEVQRLTGAFVQVDVRGPGGGQFERVFSGWLWKESPSLNVVEHPVYDVWPKSCAMTHPEDAGSSAPAAAPASNRSSAPNSAATPRPAPAPAPAASPAPAAESEPTADESN